MILRAMSFALEEIGRQRRDASALSFPPFRRQPNRFDSFDSFNFFNFDTLPLLDAFL